MHTLTCRLSWMNWELSAVVHLDLNLHEDGSSQVQEVDQRRGGAGQVHVW